MKTAKLLGMCLCLCFTLTVVPKSNAANPPAPQIVLVGSSGAWYSMAVSSVEPDPITAGAAPCTGATSNTTAPTNFWTQKNGSSSPVVIGGLDARSVAPHEGGNVWISWNADATTIPYGPNPIVCAYLSVDSVVGQRMLFGTASGKTGSLILDATEAAVGAQPTCNPGPANCGVPCPGPGKLGAKAVPQFDDSANPLPCTVWNILNSTPTFNGAATDIRPEDALFANTRALSPCSGACGTDTSKNGLGYGPYPTGLAVNSAFDTTSANVIAYNLTGNDPISTADTVTPGAVIQIGAYPLMIFANILAKTNPGDFGNQIPTNINSHVFGQVFSSTSLGGASRTSDVTGSLTIAGTPMNIVNREPVSGTWNVTEWQLVRNQGFFHSQEEGVDPANNSGVNCTTRPVAANCGNPFFMSYPDGATRRRAIGTGQLVNAVGGKSSSSTACVQTAPYSGGPLGGLPNGIGYAFWSFATYADLCVHADLRYLALDGLDPLFATPSADPNGAGVFPTCTTPGLTCQAVPFTNMVNGNYRAWNIIRMVMKNTYVAPSSGPSVPGLVLAAQNQAHVNIPDFVPFVYCITTSCTPATVNTSQPLWVTAPTGVTTGLTAFRSHVASPCQTPISGVTVCPQMGNPEGNLAIDGTNQTAFFAFPPWSENEADMAGAVLTVQSDIDSLSDFGADQLDLIQ